MTRAAQLRCFFYAAIALAALYGTWSNNLAYFKPGGSSAGASFLADLAVNHATRSFAIDLGFLLLAAAVLMVVEARRLGMRLPWLYILLGFLVAISVSFPLFLIARERRMASPVPAVPPSAIIVALDAIGLAAVTAVALAFLVWLR
jgi:hypothetical protein